MINYIKSLFIIRPEIEQVIGRLGECETRHDIFVGVDYCEMPTLSVSFYWKDKQVYDFTVNNLYIHLSNKEKKCISKALQKLEKQREDEKLQKAYSLLKSNLEKQMKPLKVKDSVGECYDVCLYESRIPAEWA